MVTLKRKNSEMDPNMPFKNKSAIRRQKTRSKRGGKKNRKTPPRTMDKAAKKVEKDSQQEERKVRGKDKLGRPKKSGIPE
jgi:hypothetical protein